MWVQPLASLSGASYGVGRRCGSDLVLLWPAVAALIQPLAQEFLFAAGVAIKKGFYISLRHIYIFSTVVTIFYIYTNHRSSSF